MFCVRIGSFVDIDRALLLVDCLLLSKLRVYMCVCVMAGKSSSSDGSAIAMSSPVHRLHPDKLQSWSSLFRSRSHGNVSSLSSPTPALPHQHRLPVHSSVSKPFKSVGCNTARSIVDSSLSMLPPPTVSLPPSCMSPEYQPPRPVSSECPLPFECAAADSCQQMSVSSEDSFVSSVHSSSVDEDPTAPSLTVHSPALPSIDNIDTLVKCRPLMHTAASEPKLSAAARISMALSEYDAVPQSQNGSDVALDGPSSEKSYMSPTTKISMALTEHTSQIGRRLSTMLQNSRLRQHSSSDTGMMFSFVNSQLSILFLLVKMMVAVSLHLQLIPTNTYISHCFFTTVLCFSIYT